MNWLTDKFRRRAAGADPELAKVQKKLDSAAWVRDEQAEVARVQAELDNAKWESDTAETRQSLEDAYQLLQVQLDIHKADVRGEKAVANAADRYAELFTSLETASLVDTIIAENPIFEDEPAKAEQLRQMPDAEAMQAKLQEIAKGMLQQEIRSGKTKEEIDAALGGAMKKYMLETLDKPARLKNLLGSQGIEQKKTGTNG